MSSCEEIELIIPSDDEFEDHNDSKPKKTEEKRAENNVAQAKAISTTIEEMTFRQKNFGEFELGGLKLMCTSCGKNLELNLSHSHWIASHPLLEVILCKTCANFYGEGDFSVDEDGTDKYCRWCGQGGVLYLCSDCNFAFCRMCIKRNLNRSILKDVDSDDWKCFSCNSEPLWELRGICAVTMKYIKERKAKRKEARSLSKSLNKVCPYSSSEEEERSKGTKKRKLRRSSSVEKNELKRHKKGDSNSHHSSEKKKNKESIEYSKKVDRKTVLDPSYAKSLVSKIKEHSSDFFELVQAISSESKNVLRKEKLSFQQVQDFKERYNIVKKLVAFRDLSCNSISQACENFIMAYQNIIESYNNEKCKNNSIRKNNELCERNHSMDDCESESNQSKRKVTKEKDKVSDDSEAEDNESKGKVLGKKKTVSDDSEAEDSEFKGKGSRRKKSVSDVSEAVNNESKGKAPERKKSVSDNSEAEDNVSKGKDHVRKKNVSGDSEEEDNESKQKGPGRQKCVSDVSEVEDSESKGKGHERKKSGSDNSEVEDNESNGNDPGRKKGVSDDSEVEGRESKIKDPQRLKIVPDGSGDEDNESKGKGPGREKNVSNVSEAENNESKGEGAGRKMSESDDSEVDNNESKGKDSGREKSVSDDSEGENNECKGNSSMIKGTMLEAEDNQCVMDDTEEHDDKFNDNDNDDFCVKGKGNKISKKKDNVILDHNNVNNVINKISEKNFSAREVDCGVNENDSFTNNENDSFTNDENTICSNISRESKGIVCENSREKDTLEEILVHGKMDQSKLNHSPPKHSSKELTVDRMDCDSSINDSERENSSVLVVKETSSEDSESDSEEITLAHIKSNLNKAISLKGNEKLINNVSSIEEHDKGLSDSEGSGSETILPPNLVPDELLEKEKVNYSISEVCKPEICSESRILKLDDVTKKQHLDCTLSGNEISKLGKINEEKGDKKGKSKKYLKVKKLCDDNKQNDDYDNNNHHNDGDLRNNKTNEQINKDVICEASDDNQNSVHDIDSERKAMFSLLASSSDDDISVKNIKNYSGYDSDCSEAESQKSSSCNTDHQRKIRLETLLISDDLNFMEKSAQWREDGVQYEVVKNCSVKVEKLPQDIFEKYYDESSNSQEGKRKEPSETTIIDRLVNLKTLDKSNTKQTSDSKSTLETDISSKSAVKKPVKKSDKVTLKDFHNIDSDGGSGLSDNSDETPSKEGRPLKNILEELNKKNNKLAKELLLMSSDSDEPFEICEDKKEKKKELSAVENVKKTIKKEESDNEDIVQKEKESEISDESGDEIFKKSSWRNNKLLKMKLSESDTSDDERRWNAKKLREAKEEGKGRKSIKRRTIAHSDSDFELHDSESSGEDFKEISKVINKRKRKDSSDSDKSKSSTSGSDSDKSQKKKPKRRRIRKPASDSSNSDADGETLNNSQKSDGTPGKGRKNIRKVLKDDDVVEETRRAAKEEEERAKRIAEKQKLYDSLYNMREVQSDIVETLVLDFNAESKEELVKVDETLVKKLKPHQVKGVKFMWDACFESLERIKKSEGSGCILAHCMGLGKTLQVITLVHTLLSNSQTEIKSVMVVCPLSTVLNWVNEFSKWLDQLEDNDIEVFELTKYKQIYERVGVLKHWHASGGVMIIGYNMYRALTSGNARKSKRVKVAIENTLVNPGPDLVVCDEGHLLKNEGSALSKAMNLLKTRRRIVLTGTPLQNNLLEYHCMVQFVKPNLLGTKKEFSNRFINPINNGQYENSTAHDVKIMKRRAHVLHKMLDSSVQRYDYSVLTPFLPPKFEYALSIRLTELQIKLYKYYLDNIAASDGSADGTKTKTATLFKDYHYLAKIWTHPRILLVNSENLEKKRLMESDSEGSLREFIVNSSGSSSNTSSDSDSEERSEGQKSEKTKIRIPKTRGRKNEPHSSEDESNVGEENQTNSKNPDEWWRQFMPDETVFDDLRQSGKLCLLFTLLDECEKQGEKLLVFSQSISSLDLIEYFLKLVDEANQKKEKKDTLLGYTSAWSLGLDYFRLDGSTSAENRSACCKTFNREDNLRARLFLISTRAGGLGINLVAANRVVIFDASWNPSHDLQSIFRIYRFGQKKPCYIYRFLAQATMEEKIYNRQVTKLSLACRVVDEQQIERHYSLNDLKELYIFNLEEKISKDIPLVPKDIVLAELVRHEDSWILSYHEHDTLLENKEEEELNEEERKAAWEDYEKEKQGLRVNVGYEDAVIMNYLLAYGYTEQGIRDNIVNKNPLFTELQIQTQTSRVLRQLYAYITSESYQRQLQLQQYNRLSQPVYLQNPQMQPHTPMSMQQQTKQYTHMSNEQHPYMQRSSVQPMNMQASAVNPNSTLDRAMVQHKENMKNVASTSTNGSDHKIKVKNFGHLANSNFASSSGQSHTNPIAAVQYSHVGATTPQNLLTSKTAKPKDSAADVIDLE